MPASLLFLLIGVLGGVASGLFGVGGGVVLVPALIYWAGFSQRLATGTSLAVLLPPIGLAAALEYHRHGNVDIRAAVILAAGMFTGAFHLHAGCLPRLRSDSPSRADLGWVHRGGCRLLTFDGGASARTHDGARRERSVRSGETP